MKTFNTAGPCIPGEHYMLDPLARLSEARRLAKQGKYFVVCAPSQSGKTTLLTALARELNASGDYAALCFSAKAARGDGADYIGAQRNVLSSIRETARSSDLPPDCRPPAEWPDASSTLLFESALLEWAESCPRPLVLLVDEADALTGRSLRSVLAQLRDGYTQFHAPFPRSVVLCGMRDVSRCSFALEEEPSRLGTAVPFNISVASLRIGDFTLDEVAELYAQHTEETGQVFEAAAVRRAFEASRGQPWLVNALARDIIEIMGVPLSEPITEELMDQAVRRLVVQRTTHLDGLAARLYEARVQAVIEPLLTGGLLRSGVDGYEDLVYVRDLGLVTDETTPLRIANPIYEEMVVRALTRHLTFDLDGCPSSSAK